MRPVESKGKAVILSVFSNTSKTNLTLESLQRQALTFENLYDGVILTDIQGAIIDWNPAATRMFGYKKIEVLGKTPAILHKPEVAPVLTQQILKGM